MELTIQDLLETVMHYGASDLHVLANTEPRIRVDGLLEKLDIPNITGEIVKHMCYALLNESQKKQFEETQELDFAVEVPKTGRFRVNYYMERGNMGAAFRIIPTVIPSLEDFNMPPILAELSHLEKGMILVTGPTGSGKSTTMAAMINEINLNHKKHILTVEDPIEFEHKNNECIFSQREVGEDTASFSAALKYALREDPDVILVGEMRDLETIRAAITAAETGHLVMGTLHTNSASQTINRVINVFPASEQELIRTQLSMTLRAVVSQILVPKIGSGRAAVLEILVNNPAIGNLIRENKLQQLKSQMELNQANTKMQTQHQELIKLINNKEISVDVALRYAANKEEIKKKINI